MPVREKLWRYGERMLWNRFGPWSSLFSADSAVLIVQYQLCCDGRAVLDYASGTARIWEISPPGLPIRASIRGHRSWRSSLPVNPDGATVLSGSGRLNPSTASGELRSLDRLSPESGRAVFTPDRRRVVSVSNDHTMRTWLIDECELIKYAESRRYRAFTERERETFADLLGR